MVAPIGLALQVTVALTRLSAADTLLLTAPKVSVTTTDLDGEAGRFRPPAGSEPGALTGAAPPIRVTAEVVAALNRLNGQPWDTVRRRKRGALVSYSGFYSARLTLHRVLSFAMVPLFIGSYVTGEQLIRKGPEAPAWARRSHGPLATGTAVVFGLNTITGLWNLWDSRKDPSGRFKRYLHSILFTGATAAFTYAGTTLAEDAEQSASKRSLHRTVALSAMGVSVVSWSMMLLFK